MQIGESKKLQTLITMIHKCRHNFYRDFIQRFYIELCAAAGLLIKNVDGMKVMVRWGDNCVR